MSKHFRTLEHEVRLPYQFSTGPIIHRFFEGLKEKRILSNSCPSCGKVLVPPRSFCPLCNGDMSDVVEAAQEGTVKTWTLVSRGSFGMPVDPPFIGALVRLDGTDCDLLHIVGGLDLSDLAAVAKKLGEGGRVRAVWREEREGHLLDIRHFEPIER
jgi:uncharacterized OB-fold protein